jgi:hypothetical protein
MLSHRDDVADHDRRRAGGPARRADPLQRRSPVLKRNGRAVVASRTSSRHEWMCVGCCLAMAGGAASGPANGRRSSTGCSATGGHQAHRCRVLRPPPSNRARRSTAGCSVKSGRPRARLITSSPSPIPAGACRAAGASRRSAAVEQIGDLRRRHSIEVVRHLALAGQQAEPPQRCRRRISSFQRRDAHHRPSGLADHKRRTSRSLLDQPRQVGLGLLDVHLSHQRSSEAATNSIDQSGSLDPRQRRSGGQHSGEGLP